MLIRIIGILPLIAVVSMSLLSDRKKERNENKVTREGEKINRSTQVKNPKLKGLHNILTAGRLPLGLTKSIIYEEEWEEDK
jgi:hypothetical protein